MPATNPENRVDWEAQDLLRFFHAQGFQPAARLCLDVTLDPERSGRRAQDEQSGADEEVFGGPPGRLA